MVVGEAGADGRIGFEAAIGGVEVQFRGVEGVVFVEFYQPMVHSASEVSIQVIKAEVEIPHPIPGHQYSCDGLPLQISLFLVQPGKPHSFCLHFL